MNDYITHTVQIPDLMREMDDALRNEDWEYAAKCASHIERNAHAVYEYITANKLNEVQP